MSDDPRGLRITAGLLVTGALAANAAFAGLGAVFGYPDVLQRPAEAVLAEFRLHQAAVVGWFLLLALGAALFTPIAIRLGGLSRARAMRLAVPVGVAASLVQVIGLARWPLLVPGLAGQAADPATAAQALRRFETLGAVLGTAVGETAGYLLTALWTALVVLALGPSRAGGPRPAGPLAGRWFAALGLASALLIAAGALVPLGVPGADLANFIGYLLWSGWLVAFAVVLLGRARAGRPEPAGARGTG